MLWIPIARESISLNMYKVWLLAAECTCQQLLFMHTSAPGMWDQLTATIKKNLQLNQFHLLASIGDESKRVLNMLEVARASQTIQLSIR